MRASPFLSPATETKKGFSGTRSGLKRGGSIRKIDHGSGGRVGPASLPVNIPDWSKILKEDYKEHRKWESNELDVGDENELGDQQGGIKIPPHEYLARTRGASLSVHEGIGRTLKGRDLRSVRNAIWKKVGFED
ncbi:Senescence regulator S40 [Sesbania bispinosa]|nr:Senescence regulator S40 [Sesbania bispinosa]